MPAQGNNWYQIIVVLMLATGAFFIQLPLRSERPVPSGSGMKAAGMQDIDARLWQDPFGAALQARQNAKANCLSISPTQSTVHPCPDPDGKRDLAWLSAQIQRLASSGKGPTSVLIATVPGGNWVGADEVRRRLRYAMLAGLNTQQFVPADPEHIGYVEHHIDGQQIVVPFEWFEYEAADAPANKRSAVLVWLDEEALLREMPGMTVATAPLDRLGQVVQAFAGADGVALVGPYSSTFMVSVEQSLQRHAKLPPALHDLRWYAPYATRVADPRLPANQFHPMIADDTRLASALADELALRGFGHGRNIALIGQWDTTYARALRKNIRAALEKRGFHGRFLEASYLRGIDGLVAGKKVETDKERDKTGIEQPEGDSQIDYLRRVAVDLKLRERELGRIGAIGVFGDDYHDKILALKALRPEFPTAVFFSTDLNSAMLHPADNPYTRNLVVASGYHLSLAPSLQQDIPPFRDSYQTAGFLATQAALFDLLKHRPPAHLDGALVSHIFEIGRTRAMALRSTPAVPDECASLDPCRHPHPGNLSPPPWQMLLTLPAGIVLAALFTATAGLLRREHLRHWLLACLAAGLVGAAFIAFLHYQPSEREPFSWLQGISIWPTEILRLVALVLAAWLILRGDRRLRENAERITQKFFPPIPDCVPPENGQTADSIWFTFLRDKQRGKLAPPDSLPTAQRVLSLLAALLLIGALVYFSPLGGITAPIRGNAEVWIDKLVLLPTLALFLVLVFRTFDATLHGIWLAKHLSAPTCWPEALIRPLWPQVPGDDGAHVLDSWLDAQLIAEATEPIQKMLFYPFAVIALLVIARAPLFDAWFFPLVMVIAFSLIALALVVLALRLRSQAEAVRHKAIDDLNACLLRAQAQGQDALVKQANLLINQIKALNMGAFAPFTQQPLIKSALTLGASFSGLALLDYASLMNF